MQRFIQVVPYDPGWVNLFEQEAALLRAAFGPELVAVHHIGSTSVPGLSAKPVIDILPEVHDIERVDALDEAMIGLGYIPRGEAGISGRRFFIKPSVTERTHHVHTFQAGTPEVARHLAFRDYLRAHPDDARQYGALKERLALQFPEDIMGYMDGKDAFIKELERKALEWAANT